MNHRELALAALRGQHVDHVPFIARMDLWYEYHRHCGSLPAPYQQASLYEMQRDLGVGIHGRGGGAYYRLESQGVDKRSWGEGERTWTEWRTPHGTLTACDIMASALHGAAIDPARVVYPWKAPSDYDAVQYLVEHTEVVPDLERFERLARKVGDDGLTMPSTMHLPAHQLMIDYMGYLGFYEQLHDNPRRLDALIAAVDHQFRKMLDLALQCAQGAIWLGSNYDETITPPPIFERFFAPLYREFAAKLASRNQVMIVHGDGEMRTLLRQIMDCGIPAVEAITPKPMTSIDVAEVRRLWGDRVTFWGGIACVMLTDTFTNEQFEAHLEGLFRDVAPGDRFILGFGDNVPTDALWSRILRVVEFWRQHGAYPIRV